MKQLLISIVTLALTTACAVAPLDKPATSRLIISGGEVFDPAAPGGFRRASVVIEGERIIAVESEVSRGHLRGARIIDVAGGLVLPGLVDAHAHIGGLGAALESVNLVGAATPEEMFAWIAERARQQPAGEWVLGRGWDQNLWPVQDFPTAAELDRFVPDHPVWVRRIDGHAALANTAAMRAAGITAATPDLPGGRIIRDEAGEPTGVFIDAMSHVDRVVPPSTREQRKRQLIAATRNIAAHGITAVHDAGVDQTEIEIFQELADEGNLPIRVYALLTDNEKLLDHWFSRGPLLDYGDRLTVRAVKVYLDGALGSRGAALLEPYDDEPSNIGLVRMSPERLVELTRRARAAGFQIGAHAIGDAAVRAAVDSFEAGGVTPADRFRIEHFQVAHPAEFPRVARLGIIASMQPTHATSDMYWAEQRIGRERARGAYAWRTVLEHGGRLAFGSDFPVEEVNPLHGLHAAVYRQDLKGWPDGGWFPGQRMTLVEAIQGFTSWAAFAAFQEGRAGELRPGQLADLTVISGPANAEGIATRTVRYTIVGGKLVHQAGEAR
jgi:predicted amidohydrolase YtcJ